MNQILRGDRCDQSAEFFSVGEQLCSFGVTRFFFRDTVSRVIKRKSLLTPGLGEVVCVGPPEGIFINIR
jgi:hypothetical protein